MDRSKHRARARLRAAWLEHLAARFPRSSELALGIDLPAPDGAVAGMVSRYFDLAGVPNESLDWGPAWTPLLSGWLAT